MAQNTPLLQVDGVSTGYGSNEIVHKVSLHVNRGESVCIIGPNGAGKSTLLKAITGYLPCWSGSIQFKGEDITDKSTEDLVSHGICTVGQGRIVFPRMTVKENLDMGAWSVSDDQREKGLEKVYEVFPRIEERLSQKASSLSGGEQQMVALARAIMVDPDLLVLDEPSLGLAPKLVNKMYDYINILHDEDISILLVEQNAAKALRNTDRGYVLEMGELEYSGDSNSLYENGEVKKLYLGG